MASNSSTASIAPNPSPITSLLGGNGDDARLAEDLLPLVYDELRRLAAARMASERSGHTLQATALVHEAWMKLAGGAQGSQVWNGRRHFYAAAAEAMRRILIDHARRKLASRRGGDWLRITMGDREDPQGVTPPELIDLNSALEKLARIDEERAAVAKLRIFGGLTIAETAEALELSEATISRRWSFAKAWLSRELKKDQSDSKKE